MTAETKLPWMEHDAYREVTAYPETYDAERFSLRQLRSAAEKAMVLFRGWPFIFVDRDGRETRAYNSRVETEADHSSFRGYPSFERWELHQSGLFFHKILMDEDSHTGTRQQGKVIGFTFTIYHVAEAIGSLWRLYQALELPESELLSIEFRYTDMYTRKLETLDPRRASIWTSRPCNEPEVGRRRQLPLAEWRASDADIAAQILVELFERFGWDDPNLAVIQKMTHEFMAKPRFS